MKTTNLSIQQPVRIIPINGETNISIVSTGDYVIAKSPTGEHRVRSITLSDTGKATLSRSLMGQSRTVKIILASEEASEEEFVRQVRMLFRQNKTISNG